MSFVTLAALAGFCILAGLHKYAIILTGLCMYLWPVYSFGTLALAGITYFTYRRFFV